MINLFKDLRIKYNVINIILFVVLFITAFRNYSFSYYNITFALIWLIAAILIFANAIIFIKLAVKRHDKITLELNERCDPIGFINLYYPLSQQKTDKATSNLVKLNLAAGYISAGDFTQAKNVLSRFDSGNANTVHRILYFIDSSSLCRNENNLIDAQRWLNEAKALIDSTKMNAARKSALLSSYNYAAAALNIETGCYQGVEELLNDCFNNADFMLARVNAKYLLGILYYKQGRIEEARRELAFVVDNGNRLFDVQEARGMLAEM